MTTQAHEHLGDRSPLETNGNPLDEAIAATLAALQALDDTIEAMWARQTAVIVKLREGQRCDNRGI